MESRYAAYVGRSSSPVEAEVERGHIRRFAEAVGDPNPIYYDEAAARSAGYPRIPAPPTFAAALRPGDPRDGLPIDWRKLLHAEQQFHSQRPLYAGDRLTLVQTITGAYVKEGKAGPMDFMQLETIAKDPAGQEVYTARTLIVIRR